MKGKMPAFMGKNCKMYATMQTTMTNKLFVYGTLGPGRPNEHILKAIGGTWEEGVVLGNLKNEGWGAAMGYPGIILDEKGGKVTGNIFTSDQLVNHWEYLDAFEGLAYERVVTTVFLADESQVEAYVYVLRQ